MTQNIWKRKTEGKTKKRMHSRITKNRTLEINDLNY